MQYGCGDSVFFESIEEAIRVSDEIAERAKEKMIHDAISALGVQNCDSCKLLAEKGLRCLRMEILREIGKGGLSCKSERIHRFAQRRQVNDIV